MWMTCKQWKAKGNTLACTLKQLKIIKEQRETPTISVMSLNGK